MEEKKGINEKKEESSKLSRYAKITLVGSFM